MTHDLPTASPKIHGPNKPHKLGLGLELEWRNGIFTTYKKQSRFHPFIVGIRESGEWFAKNGQSHLPVSKSLIL